MRLRTQHGPANMATVRHITHTMLGFLPGKQSLAVKCKAAGRDDAFLLQTLTHAPLAL